MLRTRETFLENHFRYARSQLSYQGLEPAPNSAGRSWQLLDHFLQLGPIPLASYGHWQERSFGGSPLW